MLIEECENNEREFVWLTTCKLRFLEGKRSVRGYRKMMKMRGRRRSRRKKEEDRDDELQPSVSHDWNKILVTQIWLRLLEVMTEDTNVYLYTSGIMSIFESEVSTVRYSNDFWTFTIYIAFSRCFYHNEILNLFYDFMKNV